jgi:DMSO reductase family type II enzyme heme b subunit
LITPFESTTSAELSGREPFEDAVSLEFPVESRPYFGMGGEAKGVIVWQWKSEGVNASQETRVIGYKGPKNAVERENVIKAFGEYEDGAWRVIMKAPLKTGSLEFKAGEFTPIAFAAWDGSNQEKGSKHVMTTWHWLIMQPKTSGWVYLWPVVIALGIVGLELLWLKSARKKNS